jgi:H+-transporting ATPase
MPWRKQQVKTSSRVPPEWLETDMNAGLSTQEAQDRQKRIGPNELESKKENQVVKVLSYFRGPIFTL